MSFPVFIHQDNGHFVATLVGSPDLSVTGASRELAIHEMRRALQTRFAKGELVFLDLPTEGILAAAGKYRDDPYLSEICDEAYRQRDAEPKE